VFIPIHDGEPLKRIGLPWVTWSLIAATVLVFVVLEASGGDAAINAAALYAGVVPALVTDRADLAPGLVALPPAATLLTYAFVHAGWLHLAGNMAFLWVFADNVEDAVGHRRFLVFYLACAAASAAAHVAAAPGSVLPLVGASGAVGGIVGGYLVLHPRVWLWVLVFGRIPVRLPAALLIGLWIAFQVFKLVTDGAGDVSWSAHLGGLAAGAALVVALRRPGVPLFDRGVAAAP